MERLAEKFNRLDTVMQMIVVIATAVLVIGIVGPSMISSNSTVSVWMGIAIVVSYIYTIWVITSDLRDKIKDRLL